MNSSACVMSTVVKLALTFAVLTHALVCHASPPGRSESAAFYDMGLIFEKSKMYKDAIEAYKSSIGLSNNFAEAYMRLGAVYSGLGMNREAAEIYRRLIKVRPDIIEAYKALGQAYLNTGKHDDAAETLRELIAMNPADEAARPSPAALYFRMFRVFGSIEKNKKNI